MATIDRYVERPLTAADASAGNVLSDTANWNQTPGDWAYLLRAARGFGFVDPAGTLVATALALPYGAAFGWIGMVLVRPRDRGAGLATRLMSRCLDALARDGRVAMLDATPAGRPVYTRLGFHATSELHRLRCPEFRPLSTPARPAAGALRAARETDRAAIASLDAQAFGAPRAGLIAEIHARLPSAAFVAEDSEGVTGFVLARDGRTSTHVGPLVAADESTAIALSAAALATIRGPVTIDVPDRHEHLANALAARGFSKERPFTRMALGRDRGFERLDRLFSIAGPELG